MLIKLGARRQISAAFRPRTRRVGSSPIDATVVATIAMLLPAALRPARLIRDVRMRQPQPLSHSVLAAALSCALLTGDPAASLGRVVDLDTPVGALQQQEKTIGDLFERAIAESDRGHEESEPNLSRADAYGDVRPRHTDGRRPLWSPS